MVEEFDLLKDKEIVDIGAAGGYNFAVMVYEK
jgi:protein-L-isoaspartate O-methyltransferase